MKIDLKDTVELMLSENQAERMRAEYLQLIIRKNKLGDLMWKIREGKIKKTSDEIHQNMIRQFGTMRRYKKLLEEKAALMKIDLKAPLKKEE